jgi:ribonuclease HII
MPDYELEKKYLNKKENAHVCGVDEVGRGALFGPVVAGAVILDSEKLDYRLNDSKKLSSKKRLELASVIYENSIAHSVGWIWNDVIDDTNILIATKKAMEMSVKKLQISPDYVLIDGMKPDFLNIIGEGVVKGDSKSLSIAAASIIAKVFRDQLIVKMSRFFSCYDLGNNKGYPTEKHIKIIELKGQTFFHRKSFRIKRWQRTKDQV